MKKILAVLLSLSMLFSLVACSGKQKMSNVDSSKIESPSAGDSVSASQSDGASSASSSAPQAKDMDAEAIANALKDAGLPIDNIIVYDEATDPNGLLGRPNQYISKVNFADTTLEQFEGLDPVGGSIEVFKTKDDAKARFDYINALGKEASIFGYYLYLNDCVLLRVELDLTPSAAGAYEKAFNDLMDN